MQEIVSPFRHLNLNSKRDNEPQGWVINPIKVKVAGENDGYEQPLNIILGEKENQIVSVYESEGTGSPCESPVKNERYFPKDSHKQVISPGKLKKHVAAVSSTVFT